MIATIALLLLAVATAVQVVWLFRKDAGKGTVQAAKQAAGQGSPKDPASTWLLAAAAILLVVVTVQRSIAIGFVALTGTYESLMFYAAFVAALTAGYRLQKKLAFAPVVAFGASFVAVVLMAIASSPMIPKDVLPPIPALRSGWLVLHVAFSFIGEAFFVASFIASIAFLATRNDAKRLEFDRITYTSIAVGYPIFTAGALIFGAIWAEQAWGRWWSWDPKETWALITWLVYTLYLHVRLIMKKKDATASWIAAAGFLCTLFTFFGVNYLLPGLHSYG